MNQDRQPSRASERFERVEIVGREGKKVRFKDTNCDHKDRQEIKVNFWGQVITISLPVEGKCVTCLLPKLKAVEACGDCNEPLLKDFGMKHECPKAKVPHRATQH